MRREPADRYQSADEMLSDVERVLRSAFLPVGQTELKRWLVELGAKDGVPPISRSTTPARTTSTRTTTGTGELEEEDVVLHDTQEEEVDGEEATSLAVVRGGTVSPRPRVARSRPAPSLPVPQDAESLADLSGRAEIALPIPEGEGRPGRRPSRRGGGLSILFVGALLIAGAWFGGKYARVWFGSGSGEASGPGATAGTGAQHAQPADPQQAEPDEKAAAAVDAGAASAAPVAAHHADHGEPAASHETTARHRPDRSKDFVGRDIDGLKDMMAPDPSLLPPTPATPPPAAKPADSPAAPAPAAPASKDIP